jgi:folate-dependent phosphoribosylglycinamide formyltransferase PurN
MDFLERIENEIDIELAAIFCETTGRGLSGRVAEVWQRRRLLAIPILAESVLGFLVSIVLTPHRQISRFRMKRSLENRTHYIADVHSTDVVVALQDLKPDLGLVYGGPILRKELFDMPRMGTLGIHHGLTPDYRGKKTTFWAIHNGESFVGVTIQKIRSGLDQGSVVLEARLPVGHSLPQIIKSRLEKIGLDLYLRAITQVKNGTAEYRPQNVDRGELYKDPGASDLVRFWFRYVGRLIKLIR